MCVHTHLSKKKKRKKEKGENNEERRLQEKQSEIMLESKIFFSPLLAFNSVIHGSYLIYFIQWSFLLSRNAFYTWCQVVTLV